MIPGHHPLTLNLYCICKSRNANSVVLRVSPTSPSMFCSNSSCIFAVQNGIPAPRHFSLYFLKGIIPSALGKLFDGRSLAHSPWFWGSQCHRGSEWSPCALGHGHRMVLSRGCHHPIGSYHGYLYHLNRLLFHLMEVQVRLITVFVADR